MANFIQNEKYVAQIILLSRLFSGLFREQLKIRICANLASFHVCLQSVTANIWAANERIYIWAATVTSALVVAEDTTSQLL